MGIYGAFCPTRPAFLKDCSSMTAMCPEACCADGLNHISIAAILKIIRLSSLWLVDNDNKISFIESKVKLRSLKITANFIYIK